MSKIKDYYNPKPKSEPKSEPKKAINIMEPNDKTDPKDIIKSEPEPIPTPLPISGNDDHSSSFLEDMGDW